MMKLELCLCSQIPNIEIKTQIAVLMHSIEQFKSTNTVRLLKLAIPETKIHLFGKLGVKEELIIPDHVTPLVLFPDASAPVLTPEFCAELKLPIFLIVPDGTWTQARKLIHRRSNLYGVRRVRISRAEPSRYKLRRGQTEEGLCTLEAIAEALGVLEGVAVKDQLNQLLDLMVKRVLWTRASFGETLGELLENGG